MERKEGWERIPGVSIFTIVISSSLEFKFVNGRGKFKMS